MADAFVGTVVHIDEEGLPVEWECSCVHGIAMVLRSNETTVCPHLTHRLVMTSVSVFQFIGGGSCCLCQELVAQANTHARFRLVCLHELSDMPDGLFAMLRVAGAVSQEQTVKLQFVEVVVPRHPHYFEVTL